MKIPPELEGVLVATPDTLHGAVRFAGTRVFAHQLFDYILGGDGINAFLEDFPNVERSQVDRVLSHYRASIARDLELAGSIEATS